MNTLIYIALANLCKTLLSFSFIIYELQFFDAQTFTHQNNASL